MLNSCVWLFASPDPDSSSCFSSTTGVAGEGSASTRAAWVSVLVTESSNWGGGDGVDVMEEADDGEADVHGEVATENV
jgi:hypothetical protein